jgi:soluble lytic murein transglycosylase-like protein
VVGIMQVESAFNPMAISNKNARGLMQVMPEWVKYFELNKVCDLHDIEIGILTGIKVLKIHIEEEGGDVSEGLYKYVNKDRNYVNKVYSAVGKFVMFRGLTADKKTQYNNQ